MRGAVLPLDTMPATQIYAMLPTLRCRITRERGFCTYSTPGACRRSLPHAAIQHAFMSFDFDAAMRAIFRLRWHHYARQTYAPAAMQRAAQRANAAYG